MSSRSMRHFKRNMFGTPLKMAEEGFILVHVKGRAMIQFAPYNKYGTPKLKAQAQLRRLKRRGAFYSLVGDK